ncbi:MAG: hypothetical protein ACP6IP_09990 [Candidatus Njordarchaeia archaeon]
MLLKLEIIGVVNEEEKSEILDKLLAWGLQLKYIDLKDETSTYYFDVPSNVTEIEALTDRKYDFFTGLREDLEPHKSKAKLYLIPNIEAEDKTGYINFVNEEVELHAFLPKGTIYHLEETMDIEINFVNKTDRDLLFERRSDVVFTLLFYDINERNVLTLKPREDKSGEITAIKPGEKFVEKTKIDTGVLRVPNLYYLAIQSPTFKIGKAETFYLTNRIEIKILDKKVEF